MFNPQPATRNPQPATRNWARMLCAIALSGATTAAVAADGVITIAGALTDSTCLINSGNPPQNLLVKLPKVSVNTLVSVGDVKGQTAFEIALSNCPDTMNGQRVSAFFESGSTTDYDTNDLIAYTPPAAVTAAVATIPATTATLGATAANVQIRISNLDGTDVQMGRDADNQNAARFLVAGRGATLRYLASYIRSGSNPIAAGNLVSYVQYSIAYP